MTKLALEKQLKDWKIKYENLVIKKEISDEKFKYEISLLKSEIKEKDKTIDSLYNLVNKLDTKVEALTLEILELKKENVYLKEVISTQNDQISKLKARLNKDSSNSSKPSSKDGFRKIIQNNRQKSDKKAGGQPGHKGNTIERFSNPTKIIEKKVIVCDCGGEVLNRDNYIAKQIADLEILLNVTEERVFEGYCIKCGRRHIGKFSTDFVNPVQYGSKIKALCTLLSNYAFVPINKIADILCSITDGAINISPGTLVNIQDSFSSELDKYIGIIKENLIESKVLNADETGCSVNGKINWIQVFSNKFFSLYGYNKKRGNACISEMAILDCFIGILVHDHFSSYYKNTLATHSECNAHILRYLKSISEIFKHEWPKEMTKHLISILNEKKKYIEVGKNSFSADELDEISVRYKNILEKGWSEYKSAIEGKKRIKYYNDERLLLKRLGEYEEEHLRFASDFAAPFDNNQAERDLRPFKTKTKVSGCFRSNKGISNFLRTYSVISTLRKHGMSTYSNILKIFRKEKIAFG